MVRQLRPKELFFQECFAPKKHLICAWELGNLHGKRGTSCRCLRGSLVWGHGNIMKTISYTASQMCMKWIGPRLCVLSSCCWPPTLTSQTQNHLEDSESWRELYPSTSIAWLFKKQTSLKQTNKSADYGNGAYLKFFPQFHFHQPTPPKKTKTTKTKTNHLTFACNPPHQNRPFQPTNPFISPQWHRQFCSHLWYKGPKLHQRR